MRTRVLGCVVMAVLITVVWVGLAAAEARSSRVEAIEGACSIDAVPAEPALLTGWRVADEALELELRLGPACKELYILRPSQTTASLLIDGVDSSKLWHIGESILRIEGGATSHRLTLPLQSRANASNTSLFVGDPTALMAQRSSAVLLRFFVIGLEFTALSQGDGSLDSWPSRRLSSVVVACVRCVCPTNI